MTIINWFAKDKRRTTITRNIDSQDFASSIPADEHPIKHLNNNSFYIMSTTNQPTTNTQPLSLIDYIESKPTWHRRLIENFKENTTNPIFNTQKRTKYSFRWVQNKNKEWWRMGNSD